MKGSCSKIDSGCWREFPDHRDNCIERTTSSAETSRDNGGRVACMRNATTIGRSLENRRKDESDRLPLPTTMSERGGSARDPYPSLQITSNHQNAPSMEWPVSVGIFLGDGTQPPPRIQPLPLPPGLISDWSNAYLSPWVYLHPQGFVSVHPAVGCVPQLVESVESAVIPLNPMYPVLLCSLCYDLREHCMCIG